MWLIGFRLLYIILLFEENIWDILSLIDIQISLFNPIVAIYNLPSTYKTRRADWRNQWHTLIG